MKSIIINNVICEMSREIGIEYLEKLKQVLNNNLADYDIISKKDTVETNISIDYIEQFINSKQIEGCSDKTLNYYSNTLKSAVKVIGKDIKLIDTSDLREYLTYLQKNNNISNVSIDNTRRILSSFFSWLEDEDIILKSPVRRIHRIKADKVIKDVYTDENLEIMRQNAPSLRDLVIIDVLSSTGMRVGELVKLNKEDINFHERECKVFGKGNKERIVYFDARAKLHLMQYLHTRTDNNVALFISQRHPHNRLTIAGIEARLRKIQNKINIGTIHPHKFRRTLATYAIDKGMPIEQLQKLLGHQRIDTTLQYAMVKQNNVKLAHKKYIG